MAKIIFVHADGTREEHEAPDGASLMLAAVTNGVEGIVAECGGSAMCATCHVYVDPARMHDLPPPDAVEDEMLDSTCEQRRTNSRLSCQVIVNPSLEGLVVTLPERQL